MSGFNNPVIDDTGNLQITSVQSPGFSLGPPITGWQIDKNGQAYFQSISVGTGVQRVYVQAAAPSSPNINDFWVQTTNNNQWSQWNGSTWVAILFGTNALANGAVTAAIIAAGTIFAGIVNGTEIDGSIIRAKNSFGATILTVNKSSGTWLLYNDTGSATQGALIASGSPSSSTLSDEFSNTVEPGIVAYGVRGGSTFAVEIMAPADARASLDFLNLSSPGFAPQSLNAAGGASGGQLVLLTSGQSTSSATASGVECDDSVYAGGTIDGIIRLTAGQLNLGYKGNAYFDDVHGELHVNNYGIYGNDSAWVAVGLASGWSSVTGFAPFQVFRVPIGNGMMLVRGGITTSSIMANGAAVGTMGSGYINTSFSQFIPMNQTGGTAVPLSNQQIHLQVDTSGNVTLQGVGTSGTYQGIMHQVVLALGTSLL